MRKALLVGLVVTLGWATTASAQYLPLDGKLYVDVNGLYQSSAQAVDQRTTFSLYEEDGTFETSQRISGGALWDVGFGYRIWRELSVGLDIAQFSRNQTIEISGTAPSPLFFNEHRPFSSDALSSHKARTIALLAAWRIRVGTMEKLNLRVMAGPAHIRVHQSLASGATIKETAFPYTTVDSSVSVETPVKNGVGFVGCLDLGYSITSNIGAGLLLRYAGGSVEFDEPLAGLTIITVDAGGFQVGGGVRFRF